MVRLVLVSYWADGGAALTIAAQAAARSAAGSSRASTLCVGADFDAGPRVCPQVVHPGRIDVGSGEGAGDEQLIADAEITRRIEPRLTGLGAGGVQQQQVAVPPGAGDLAAVGAELLDDVALKECLSFICLTPCSRGELGMDLCGDGPPTPCVPCLEAEVSHRGVAQAC